MTEHDTTDVGREPEPHVDAVAGSELEDARLLTEPAAPLRRPPTTATAAKGRPSVPRSSSGWNGNRRWSLWPASSTASPSGSRRVLGARSCVANGSAIRSTRC